MLRDSLDGVKWNVTALEGGAGEGLRASLIMAMLPTPMPKAKAGCSLWRALDGSARQPARERRQMQAG